MPSVRSVWIGGIVLRTFRHFPCRQSIQSALQGVLCVLAAMHLKQHETIGK
jgi:hypothetical protein